MDELLEEVIYVCPIGNRVENNENNMEVKRFMSLLVPNQKQIHAFILYLVPNRTDADDILQDTLSEMWNKFQEYREGTNFVSWGLTIAKYKVYAFMRKNNRYHYLSHQTLELLQHEVESGQGLGFIQEQIEILKKCIQKLSDKEKKILRLRYERNLTFDGIAEQFGISMQAVYKTVSRIHAGLAKCIQLTLRLRGTL